MNLLTEENTNFEKEQITKQWQNNKTKKKLAIRMAKTDLRKMKMLISREGGADLHNKKERMSIIFCSLFFYMEKQNILLIS